MSVLLKSKKKKKKKKKKIQSLSNKFAIKFTASQ